MWSFRGCRTNSPPSQRPKSTALALADSAEPASVRTILVHVNDVLRDELLAMRAEDLRVREELLQAGEPGQGYSPRMEAVHRRNAARLGQIIAEHGWPDRDLAGDDGTLAAWFIAQHAIGEPDFQRQALSLVQEKVRQGKVPAAQEAYLSDRIALHEGRPQRYGTQSLPCPDGQYRRWQTEDPGRLNARRAAVGLPPVGDDPPKTDPSPESLAEYQEWLRDYEAWLHKAGWRAS